MNLPQSTQASRSCEARPRMHHAFFVKRVAIYMVLFLSGFSQEIDIQEGHTGSEAVHHDSLVLTKGWKGE